MSSLNKTVNEKNQLLVDSESDRDDLDSDILHDGREEDSFNHHFSSVRDGPRANNNEDFESFGKENDFGGDDVITIDGSIYDSDGSDSIHIQLSDCEDLCDIASEDREIDDSDAGTFHDYKINTLIPNHFTA